MNITSLIALVAFVGIIVCYSIHQYLHFEEEREYKKLQDTIISLYRSLADEGDRNAFRLFHNANPIINQIRMPLSEFRLSPGDTLASIAYESYCKYMSCWKKRHQELEDDILKLRSEALTESDFLSEVHRLGTALEDSQIELETLESEADFFYSRYINNPSTS